MENNLPENTEKTGKKPGLRDSQSLCAYALMSWLLITLPLLLIFANSYIKGDLNEEIYRDAFIAIIFMCSVVAAFIGLVIGLLITLAQQKHQIPAIILAPFFGIIWGIVVGGIGGLPLFFIGGIFLGWIIAVPLGVIAFTLFAIIYEPLAARRRLYWWQIILIEVGIVSVLLSGGFYFLKLSYPDL